MEMSFFVSCPPLPNFGRPRKSGHTPTETFSIQDSGSWCPDFRGTLMLPVTGHGAKKDISMLMGLNKGNYVALRKGQE